MPGGNKQPLWQSQLGFGQPEDGSQSRRHSFAAGQPRSRVTATSPALAFHGQELPANLSRGIESTLPITSPSLHDLAKHSTCQSFSFVHTPTTSRLLFQSETIQHAWICAFANSSYTSILHVLFSSSASSTSSKLSCPSNRRSLLRQNPQAEKHADNMPRTMANRGTCRDPPP